MRNINKSFEEIVIKSNSKRILIIGSLYTFVEIIGLILSTMGFFNSDIRQYVAAVVLIHLMILPMLYYLMYKRKPINLKWIDNLEYLYYTVIVIWGSTFTALIYLSREDITIYVMVVLLCSSVFTVRPKRSRLLFASAITFFGILIYMYAETMLAANALFFKSLIVTMIAYMISMTGYRIRKELHETNKKLLRVNEQLKDQVIRDSLTGLYNNGYIFDYIDHEVEKTKRYDKSLSLIMLDIDDFKQVNDQFGHLEGDNVIKAVADILKNETREFDLPARYGGEEFLIVMTNTDISTANQVAERIRRAIENLKFSFDHQITVSVGLAQWDKDTRSSLIKKADDQLYKAKASGKNRIM